jgi:hypothetical protein
VFSDYQMISFLVRSMMASVLGFVFLLTAPATSATSYNELAIHDSLTRHVTAAP